MAILATLIDKLKVKYYVSSREKEALLNIIRDNFKDVEISPSNKAKDIFKEEYAIKAATNSISSIHLGYGTMREHRCLLINFNPTKLTSNDLRVIRYIHNTLHKPWTVSQIDVAFDVRVEKENIHVLTSRQRKYTPIEDSIYFGRRNSRGYLKVYDKLKELKDKNKKRVAQNYDAPYVTRYEFTYRPDSKHPWTKHLMNIDLEQYFYKSYSFHNKQKLSTEELEEFIKLYSAKKRDLSKQQRVKLENLKEKSRLSLEMDSFYVIKNIINLLKDAYYLRSFLLTIINPKIFQKQLFKRYLCPLNIYHPVSQKNLKNMVYMLSADQHNKPLLL